MNWLDVMFGMTVLGYWYLNRNRGTGSEIVQLSGWVVATGAALTGYERLAGLWVEWLGVSNGLAKMAGFGAIWLVVRQIWVEILGVFYLKLAKNLELKVPKLVKEGVILGSGLVVATVMVLVMVVGMEEELVLNSWIGRRVMHWSKGLDKEIEEVVENTISDVAYKALILPSIGESYDLGVKLSEGQMTVDFESEKKMVVMINTERQDRLLDLLKWDEKMAVVGRKYAREMWRGGYFAHIGPDGSDPFGRMKEGGVVFGVGGENLAWAGDADTAHQGLMESPTHRRNILGGEYGRIGVGVIDGGKQGKVFVVLFAD